MAPSRRYPSSNRSNKSTIRVLLLLSALTLLVLDLPATRPLRPVRNAVATVFSPVRAAGRAVFSPVGNGWKGAFGYDDVKADNEKLRAELDERASQDAEIARLEKRVAELERMNEVTVDALRVRLAEVTADPLSNFDQSVQIDLGSKQGVKRGMAVITGLTTGSRGGLYGRVDQVRANSSTVKLLTTPSFAVGATVAGHTGVLEGQGRGADLRLTGISANAEVKKGAWVYTSTSDDSQFPKNLVVGRVTRADKDATDLSWTIEVEPLADLGGQLVKVVYKDPPR